MRDKLAAEKTAPSKTDSDLAPISLRVHTRVVNEKPSQRGQGRLPDKWARFALVFDCETTIDIRQDLTFLWWRFCERKEEI